MERLITIIAEELACKHPFRVAPTVAADRSLPPAGLLVFSFVRSAIEPWQSVQ